MQSTRKKRSWETESDPLVPNYTKGKRDTSLRATHICALLHQEVDISALVTALQAVLPTANQNSSQQVKRLLNAPLAHLFCRLEIRRQTVLPDGSGFCYFSL